MQIGLEGHLEKGLNNDQKRKNVNEVGKFM